MEDLPVRLLTELITADEIQTANDVAETHEVLYCPVGIRLPNESRFNQKAHDYDNNVDYSEFCYSPRAYLAVKVWETVRDELLSRAEFSGALDVEWQPVAASFNSICFVNGYPELFIQCMFEEMERLANSGTITVQYGRFDEPPVPELPGYPRRHYIMTSEIYAKKYRNYNIEEDLKAIQGKHAKKMSWKDIKDVFVVLKPIQLAFIAGKPMNRHTPLDDEFIDACERFKLKKVKKLVAQGANVNAIGEDGNTALGAMTANYHFWDKIDKDGYYILDNRNHDAYIKIAKYLLSQGCHMDLAGYDGRTALYETFYCDDLEIARFLLDNGADPNAPSYIGTNGFVC